jgi:hypothetical protein
MVGKFKTTFFDGDACDDVDSVMFEVYMVSMMDFMDVVHVTAMIL